VNTVIAGIYTVSVFGITLCCLCLSSSTCSILHYD